MKKSREIEVVALMIGLYCRKKHGTEKKQMCNSCTELLDYVKFRRDKCPFGDEKPFCGHCKIKCYKPQMQQEIRKVMRFSGPRLILRHPIMVIKHAAGSRKSRKNAQKTPSRPQQD